MSLAGSEAAEARRKSRSTPGFYNIELGPSYWHFSSSLSLEYNDNVTFRDSGAQSDFLITPQFNAHLFWPLSEKNSLNLDVGFGYVFYLEHSELNRITITPGSELSFDLYAGDFWFNFHDRFSFQDATQDPTVANLSNNNNYEFFQNAAGVTATWDLNKVLVRLGYDHQDNFSLNSVGSDSSSELLSSSIGYALRPLVQIGVEASGGFSEFTQNSEFGTNHNNNATDATHWSVGGFYDSQLSQYMHVRAGAGYVSYLAKTGGLDDPPFDAFYVQLSLSHRLNQFINYSLSGGRNVTFGFSGGAIDLYFATLQGSWNLIRATSLSGGLTYEHGTELAVGTHETETFTRYGANISLGRTLTRKLSASIGYQFFWRESDLANRDYTENIFRLSFAYNF